MSGVEGFLARWSRRKRAVTAAPAATPPAAPVPPESVPPDAAPAPGAARPAAFDPAGLPPLEGLTAESDFAAFLREEVPAALRRAALRRAWTLDPAIRDFVGPAEYAWDFNAPGGVPGFSLEAPTGLERLIAQAVGSAAPEEEAREGAPSPVEAAAAAPAPAPAPEPAALEAASPPDAPILEASGHERAAPATLADSPALADPPALGAGAAPVRRRHGGALPS